MSVTRDRVEGAILGAFIGEALGVGPHWYYDLEAQHADYGEWIEDYTTPQSDRYHAGCEAGENSQAGYLLKLTLTSLVKQQGYDHADFCNRLDQDFFPLIDGTAYSGPGGYTSQSIRDAYEKRVKEKREWTQTGGHADTTEAIERTLALAVCYASAPTKLAETITQNTLLTQIDETLVSMTVAYGAVLAQLVQGEPLDDQIANKLMKQVRSGELPFHTVTNESLEPPKEADLHMPRSGNFASPDALLSPSFMAQAAVDPMIQIEPAWKVSLVYGMPCAAYHILPAVYYLSARFKDDFESAVLHAINGGGQNQARAMLTGALVGAQCGLSRIPPRFLEGLRDRADLTLLASQLADQVLAD